MNWTAFDFLVAGVLIAILTIGIVAAFKFLRSPVMRLGACGLVVILVGLVWVEGAVGIFH